VSHPEPHDTPPTEAAVGSAQSGAVLRLLDRPIGAADLSASAVNVAVPAENRTRGTVGVLLFQLDQETLGVPAKHLRRITTFTRPSPVPHRSSGVLRGLCNIQGELLLCVDLRRLLGLAPIAGPEMSGKDAESDARRMVVIGPADASWVFEVDALRGVERIDPGALVPPPMTVGQAIGAFVAGLADVGDERVTILDAERLLAGFKAGLA